MATVCETRYILIVFFNIIQSFQIGKKSFPYTLPRSHLVPVEMPLFKRGKRGGREEEGKKRARSRFSFDCLSTVKSRINI